MINIVKSNIPVSVKSRVFNTYYDFKGWNKKVNKEPIFILGNQKSGTSVIAALLGTATGLSVAIDLKKEIHSPSYHKVIRGQKTLESFIDFNRFDFSRQIVKEPNLTLLFSQLYQKFPNAKFAFIIRDPRDNIRSILNRLEIPGYLTQLDSYYCNHVSRSWKLILGLTKNTNYNNIEKVNYIEKLASRWNYMTNIFLENQDKMVLVKYEDFLSDKIGTISDLVVKLGLNNKYDIRDKVDIQYQKLGQREVCIQDFFSIQNLEKIEFICGDMMKKIGYQV